MCFFCYLRYLAGKFYAEFQVLEPHSEALLLSSFPFCRGLSWAGDSFRCEGDQGDVHMQIPQAQSILSISPVTQIHSLPRRTCLFNSHASPRRQLNNSLSDPCLDLCH